MLITTILLMMLIVTFSVMAGIIAGLAMMHLAKRVLFSRKNERKDEDHDG